MNKGSKALPDLIQTTRKTENAAKVKERASKLTDRGFEGTTDLDLCWNLCKFLVCMCKRSSKNSVINAYTFADSIPQCLRKDRKKQNNIMLVGNPFCLTITENVFQDFCQPFLNFIYMGWFRWTWGSLSEWFYV